MEKGLNKELINSLQEVIPNSMNVASTLMDILCLEKDAVYRRMRGDVSFSFEELAVIARKFNISIDRILEIQNPHKSVFDVNIFSDDPKADYILIVNNFLREIKRASQLSDLKAYIATNSLPISFFYLNSSLLKFRMYKWMSQTQMISGAMPFADFQVPQKLWDAIITLQEEVNKQLESEIILDRNVFTSFAKEIMYFAKLGYLTEDETIDLKQNLLSQIDWIEQLASSGINPVSKLPIIFYLSHIDVDASYYYWENDAFSKSDFALFFINNVTTTNSNICNVQKKWIESYKRFSTLITKSGEIYKYEFFKDQRKQMEKILDVSRIPVFF